jgi:DNA polymerase theta
MEAFADELNFDVEGYYGHHGTLHPAVPPGNQLMIATIEKASAIINNLLYHNRLGELALIVVDELHMLGESRGEILETLITKIRGSIQILAMSATIPNLTAIAGWLDAKVPYYTKLTIFSYISHQKDLYLFMNLLW